MKEVQEKALGLGMEGWAGGRGRGDRMEKGSDRQNLSVC